MKLEKRLAIFIIVVGNLQFIEKTSRCKILYLRSNGFFVSLGHFINANLPQELGKYPIEDAFESFRKGVNPFGPFHDHVLEYWKESLKRPEKILILELRKNQKLGSEQRWCRPSHAAR
ncbi:Sulfotransferase domain [Dillenia turbinata]|uniref:Sulfotransferase n=1 Tax=Dillenia turbinata TaxID=194707 RepID=A0AAN8V5X9_9MAGN